MPDLSRIEASLVQGRRWIVAYDVLYSAAALAMKLKAAGALDVLAIGASRGTGALPDLPADRMLHMDVRAAGMMEAIRASEAALDDLPPELVEAVNRFDPEGKARVIRALFSTGRPVAGRPTWGARRPEWQALEDKTTIEEIWARADLPRAPSRVVPADPEALAEASRALDAGAGVVWAGDSREGFNGGATATRWVRSPAHMAEAVPYFHAHHDRVRVMPFLDGIPCSAHGIVFPDQVIALRPAEMVVFRRPDAAAFQYAGFATYWDPPPHRREELRALIRRVGAALREAVGYRGAFSLDGVMTAEGFRPTELNPRIGAALFVVFGREVSLDVLHGAMVEGEPYDWAPAELEAQLLARADRERGGAGGLTVARVMDSTLEARLVLEGGEARLAAEGEAHDLLVVVGPAAAGGYLRCAPNPERTPAGPSVAPRVLAGLRWADQAWDLGLGQLEPAPDLDARPRS